MIEADVEAKLERGVAALGYSTSLCYSVLQARPVFDRCGWFKALQSRLKSTLYPDVLMQGVIKMNLPVLGGMIHSYEQQIRLAFRRRDRSLPSLPLPWLFLRPTKRAKALNQSNFAVLLLLLLTRS